MEFSGTIFFDVVSKDVFRFADLLARASAEGAEVNVEWKAAALVENPTDLTALAASELVRVDAADRHQAFVQALLVAVHLEGEAADSPSLVALSARVAGVADDVVAPARVTADGIPLLRASTAEAGELGVTAVPSLYRHGPVLAIRSTPALGDGSAIERLDTINRVAGDDGLWSLVKP